MCNRLSQCEVNTFRSRAVRLQAHKMPDLVHAVTCVLDLQLQQLLESAEQLQVGCKNVE